MVGRKSVAYDASISGTAAEMGADNDFWKERHKVRGGNILWETRGRILGVAFHSFEWLFVRVAPIIFIGAIIGIFLTRKKELPMTWLSLSRWKHWQKRERHNRRVIPFPQNQITFLWHSCHLTPKQLCRFLHSFCNRNFKGTSGFTPMAAYTFGSLMFQQRVVGFYGGRDLRLHRCKVVVLVDHRDI